jgi:hypothetical protein
MSSTSKIAVVTAASIGMVLTQSSSLFAENQDRSEVTKAPIDLDEEVLYSALPDEALERAAALGGVGVCSAAACTQALQACNQGQPVKKPPYSSKSRTVK